MIKPRHVLMLAFPDCLLLDVTDPMQMFAGANEFLRQQAYELVILGPLRTSAGLSIVADLAIGDYDPTKLRKSDTVIAAGGSPGVARALEGGQIAGFVMLAARRGARVALYAVVRSFLRQRAYSTVDVLQLIGTPSIVFVGFGRRSMSTTKRFMCETAMSGHRRMLQQVLTWRSR